MVVVVGPKGDKLREPLEPLEEPLVTDELLVDLDALFMMILNKLMTTYKGIRMRSSNGVRLEKIYQIIKNPSLGPHFVSCTSQQEVNRFFQRNTLHYTTLHEVSNGTYIVTHTYFVSA